MSRGISVRAAYLSVGALVAGLAVGIVATWGGGELPPVVAEAAKSVGGLWLAALRMTVIPLVVVLVITAVASAFSLEAVGKLGARTVAFFVALLAGFTGLALAAAPALLQILAIDPRASARLRAAAAVPEEQEQLPTISEWFASLLPTNPVAAAAEGEMLPLVLFSILFAVGLTRIDQRLREPMLEFFAGVRDTLLVVIGWVIWAAPVGVFALAVQLGSQVGVGAAGAIAYYIVVVSGLLIVAILLLYPLARLFGKVPVGQFARAVLPAQAIAFGTRSSLASLPAMIEGAQNRMKVPETVSGFVLPVAVATFKPAAPISWIVGALFVAKLYGVELSGPDLGLIAVVSVALSFSHPGIPSGSPALKVPLYLAVGLPVEGVAILLAVDVIPDLFKTALNVTAPMAVAAAVNPRAGLSEAAVPYSVEAA